MNGIINGIVNGIVRTSLILLTALPVLTACSNPQSNNNSYQEQIRHFRTLLAGSLFSSSQIKIVNEEGKSIPGAQILIGSGEGTPFKQNFLTTDSDGVLVIPKEWTTPQAVTISAVGYMRTTFMNQLPKEQTFRLRQAETTTRYELTGTTPGINVKDGDGVADFSFVMPALQKQDILHFNIGMVISSENDVITAVGSKVPIPSNVTLPKQRENYYIPITIDKPNFRTYYNNIGTKKVFAARGQFPFKKVVGELRDGTPFVNLLNYFTIQGGGIRDVGVNLATQRMDIPVNELQFSEQRSVTNESIDDGQVLLGVALGEVQGYMVPTDVKNLDSAGTNTLRVLTNTQSQFLSIIKRQNEIIPVGEGVGRSSAVIVPFTDGVSVRHLPVIENPRVMSAHVVQLPHIDSRSDVSELATCATLALVSTHEQNGKTREVTTVLWEVYAPHWSSTVEIPNWPGDPALSGNLRWYVTLAGGKPDSNPNLDLGAGLMQAVTHVTSSAANF